MGGSDSRELNESERRIRELEAQVAELSRYPRLFQRSPVLTAIMNLEGRFVDLNGAWSEALGYEPSALIGRSFREFIHPADMEATYAESARRRQQGSHDFLIRNRYRRSDGSYAWLHWYAHGDREAGIYYCVAHDISHEVAAKDLLERTGRLAKIGGWELDLRTNALSWSDEVYRIHEVPIGAPLDLGEAINFYPPEAQPVIAAAVADGRDFGRSWDLELPLVTAGGQQIWVRVQGAAEIEGGEFVRLYGTFQDITQRHLAEDARRESDDRFRQVFEALPVPTLLLDAERDPRVNDRFEAVIGWPAEAFADGSWIELAFADEAERACFTATWEAALAAPTDVATAPEVTIPCRDGRDRVFAVRVAGDSSRVILFEEVGERRTLLGKLEAQGAALSALHDLSADDSLTYDARIARLLDLGRAHFRLESAALLRRDGESLVLEHAQNPRLTQGLRVPYAGTISAAVLESGEPYLLTAGASADQGGFAAGIAVPVRSDDHFLGVLIFASSRPTPHLSERDVELAQTFAQWIGHRLHNRRVLCELAKAKESAEAASRAKTSFLATMSHELRTPMNGIVGMADIILGTGIGGTLRERVETIRSSGLALRSVLNQVLDLSRIEAGKITLEDAPFSPTEVLGGVIDLMRARIGEKGLTLEPCFAWPPDSLALGDGLRFRQIAVNLLDNAIKFTDTGAVEIRLEVLRSGERPITRLEVQDNGPGIAIADLERLFTPFERLSAERRGGASGTGLGLAICREIAERMGGTSGCTSEVGRGSCFWVELPFRILAAEEEPEEAMSDEVELRRRDDAWAGRRVLLAEDEPVNRLVARTILESFGCVVEEVEDGQAAVERFARGRFDVVVMDCRMPRQDGFAATAAIRAIERETGRQTPILALTANAMSADRERCFAAGMDDFLTKPVTTADFDAALRRLWGGLRSRGDGAPKAARRIRLVDQPG